MQPNRISMCDDEMRLHFDNGARIFFVIFASFAFCFCWFFFCSPNFWLFMIWKTKDFVRIQRFYLINNRNWFKRFHIIWISFRLFLFSRFVEWCQKLNVAYRKRASLVLSIGKRLDRARRASSVDHFSCAFVFRVYLLVGLHLNC